MKIDKKLIKELSNYLDELNLTELEYGNNDLKIKVSKINSKISPNLLKDTNSEITSKKDEISASGTEVTSPIIGTAYLSPEPGAKKFSEIGKKIKKGETLMIVEAMKTMNHVPSPINGTIKKVCVSDGQPVEFGQTIVILD
ncbi:biotin/lipoyl-binding protein [Candidatus Pelagibacter sp.]|nr:biotin/lipoyl-binding protein [Candidatus Pelagibacter sp.]